MIDLLVRKRPATVFKRIGVVFAVCSLSLSILAQPQNYTGPQPVPLPPPIPQPLDTVYPGTLELHVDLTDIQRRVISVHETIPVTPGKVTLLYPKWIPGNHSPTGPISKVAGLNIMASGNKLEWVRDRVDVYAFHVEVPANVRSLDVDFEFLAPLRSKEGRVSISSQIADLAWNTVVLYPAGHFARQIHFSPAIKLPDGWQFATALQVVSRTANLVQFATTTLNTLVDSPLYAGMNFKRIDLSTDPGNQVFLDVFSDTPGNLAITPEEVQLHRNMVREAAKLFASHHYDHYDFLFLLSETVGGVGLEHHQSSEDGTKSNYFTDWVAGVANRDLLAHEYTHSWNGKFRRPADLWTPNFNVPMQDDLLWVYEGMTQYLGYVLTARSGLRSAEQTRDLIARVAANFEASPGRTWRPLIDTTNQPTMSQRSPVSWVSWQRPEDYYTEGMLIWLDADTKIRELSGGKKSLDDFAKLFFGIDNGSYITRTYTFADLVSCLGKVQPFDWANFLHARVDQTEPNVPEEGITRGGYRLTYTDTAPEWLKHAERPDTAISFSTSIGVSIKANGDLDNVWWGSPAFKAGITLDMQLMAVNNRAFTVSELRTAILDAEKGSVPIRILTKRGEQFETFEVNYHGGLRYPKLERVNEKSNLLDDILAPSK